MKKLLLSFLIIVILTGILFIVQNKRGEDVIDLFILDRRAILIEDLKDKEPVISNQDINLEQKKVNNIENKYVCKKQEDEILELISKENYCQTSSDCKIIFKPSCPFGCYWYVNDNSDSNRLKEIDLRIKEYYNSCPICVYDCAPITEIECINNKCI